ncbi:MAG: hypothetical protein AAGJ94_07710 [Pseudomonadota bacterium]
MLKPRRPKQLIFDAQASLAIIRWAYPDNPSRMISRDVQQNRELAQDLLSDMIECTYRQGFVQVLWSLTNNPAIPASISLILASPDIADQYFRHTDRSDVQRWLRQPRIYRMCYNVVRQRCLTERAGHIAATNASGFTQQRGLR